jgi:hypothetical protein
VSLNDELRLRLRKGILAKRDHASYFNWNADRDLEELGVIQELWSSLQASGGTFFKDFSLRGRGNDPPDLEAMTLDGKKLAIEVTELVDGQAIQRDKFLKKQTEPTWRDWLSVAVAWNDTSVISELQRLITAKDGKFNKLLGGPYPGGYCVVIFTDEPDLSPEKLQEVLRDTTFEVEYISRCFLLIGYQPFQKQLTYIDLALTRPADSF